MSLLANAWVDRGLDVSLVTIGSTAGDVYDLNGGVKRIGLDLLRRSENPFAAILNNLRRVRRLRQVIGDLRPDALVSFMTATNVLSVMAAKPFGVPVIVSERTSPEAARIERVWSQLRKYAYRRAAVVVAQTGRTANWLRKEVPGARVEVVANPVQVEARQSADAAAQMVLAACVGCNLVLAAGRLSMEKGFDLLIRAFAPIARRQTDWRLVIFGEGPERNALLQLTRDLAISSHVLFPGFSHALHLMMRRTQLFVLPSRHEGMPNSLAEAMACGVPCISFDCPTGPAELILHEDNGLLVRAEDITGLTSAMDRLMGDEALRRRLGGAAQESAREYSMENILSRWGALFAGTMKDGGAGEIRGVEVTSADRRV